MCAGEANTDWKIDTEVRSALRTAYRYTGTKTGKTGRAAQVSTGRKRSGYNGIRTDINYHEK